MRTHPQRESLTLEPLELVLDSRQMYKRLQEDLLIRMLRQGCRRAVRYLPYNLSPVPLALPGLLLHLFLLTAVYTYERARWMYALWLVSRVVHFCLDAMDGTQARRNGTQSTARHFWDHWVDVVNSAAAVLIVAKLAPWHGLSFMPFVLLTATGQLFFYLGLCRYFATGILREPYINHLWNYVFCLFLGVAVCLFDVAILESRSFQLIYAALSIVVFGVGLWNVLEDLVLLSRSPLSSLRFYVRIFAAPALILGLYVAWLHHWSNTFCARAMVVIAITSLAASIHARQLVNQPPAWLTAECVLLFLGGLVAWLPVSLHAPLHLGLLAMMALAMVLSMLRYLREMVKQHPEIGFPLVWVSSTHTAATQPVSNKRATRSDRDAYTSFHSVA